jgi:hypothetical protein
VDHEVTIRKSPWADQLWRDNLLNWHIEIQWRSQLRITVTETRGQFGKPEERGKSTIGSCYKRTGENKADWKALMFGIVRCRLYRAINRYCHLQLQAVRVKQFSMQNFAFTSCPIYARNQISQTNNYRSQILNWTSSIWEACSVPSLSHFVQIIINMTHSTKWDNEETARNRVIEHTNKKTTRK